MYKRPGCRIVPYLVLLALVLLPRVAAAQSGPTLPDGFAYERVAGGLSLPTDFAFAGDGRIFIAEKAGRVRVVQNGSLLPTPFIDISSQVNSMFDRGLLGITVHPDFPATPYVYLAYVYEPPEAASHEARGARTARIVRVTASGSNPNVAVPGSLVVLVGAGGTFDQIGNPDLNDTRPFTCEGPEPERTPVEDCLPAEGMAHTIGGLTFGPDGMLYAANGDGLVDPSGSMRAQNENSLAGKILRIDPLTGAGLPDNPFFDGDPWSNRSRVLLMAMRNPFRFDFRPEDGTLTVADVGNNRWEEINLARPGDNLGWPCFEGPENTHTGITCNGLYTGKAHLKPAYAYPHEGGRGAAIGGTYYTGDQFPASYRAGFFYGDFNADTIDFLRWDGEVGPTSAVFAEHAGAPVRMLEGPDGSLYLLSIAEGALGRIHYGAGSGTQAANASTAPALAPSTPAATVTIESPVDATRYPPGATVSLKGSATETNGAPVAPWKLRWEVMLHHNDHVHYDYYRQNGATGEMIYEDHGDNTYLEVCLVAETLEGGESRSCVNVLPAEGSESTTDDGAAAPTPTAAIATPEATPLPQPQEAVPADGAASGRIVREVWTGIGGRTVADLVESSAHAGPADSEAYLDRLEAPALAGDDYGARISGYLVPPLSGEYRFWIAADDSAELWLSTDDAPANKRLIAQVPAWTRQREWEKYPAQASAPIMLQAGTRYYIEVLHKEGDQKDNVAVAWQIPGGEREVVEGQYLDE